MYSNAIRARRAAILIVCAAIAAACNSSPVDVDPNAKADVPELITQSLTTQSATFPVSPLQLDFGSTETHKSITLTNSDTGSLNWTASVGVGWLDMTNIWGPKGVPTGE